MGRGRFFIRGCASALPVGSLHPTRRIRWGILRRSTCCHCWDTHWLPRAMSKWYTASSPNKAAWWSAVVPYRFIAFSCMVCTRVHQCGAHRLCRHSMPRSRPLKLAAVDVGTSIKHKGAGEVNNTHTSLSALCCHKFPHLLQPAAAPATTAQLCHRIDACCTMLPAATCIPTNRCRHPLERRCCWLWRSQR